MQTQKIINNSIKWKICEILKQKHIDLISTYKKFPVSCQHYAVVIPSGNQYGWEERVSCGCNIMMQFKNYPSKHAEMDALYKIRKLYETPKNVDMVVVKVNNSGALSESRPCFHCIEAMEKNKKFVIKYVYYTTKGGILVREKLATMKKNITTHISSGIKFDIITKYIKHGGFSKFTIIESPSCMPKLDDCRVVINFDKIFLRNSIINLL
jgi:hypothetical protein